MRLMPPARNICTENTQRTLEILNHVISWNRWKWKEWELFRFDLGVKVRVGGIVSGIHRYETHNHPGKLYQACWVCVVVLKRLSQIFRVLLPTKLLWFGWYDYSQLLLQVVQGRKEVKQRPAFQTSWIHLNSFNWLMDWFVRHFF